MKTVSVSTGIGYDIFIGRNILHKLSEYLGTLSSDTAVMLMSENRVYQLYGKQIEQILRGLGLFYTVFCVQEGEHSKCVDSYVAALRSAAKAKLTRTDIIIALGGGVVGDLAGFVAATYLRGIHFIQVPTTLLAMVDSSVGGKTAIDIPEGKNLVGAFYQPRLVICDTAMLDTLSPDIIIDGLAEVLKYAILFDEEFFTKLSGENLLNYDDIVQICVTYKRDIVERDEKEKGERALLNFGHTIGHSLELASKFSMSHGRAVAVGMTYISYIAVMEYHLDIYELHRILSTLLKYGYKLELCHTAQCIANGIMSDKKRRGDNITLVLPKKIGNCYLKNVPTNEFCQQILKYQTAYNKFISEFTGGN